MDDYQTYPTRAAARAALRDIMLGWPKAHIVRLYLLTDGGDPIPYQWGIEAAPNRYMRENGYVR